MEKILEAIKNVKAVNEKAVKLEAEIINLGAAQDLAKAVNKGEKLSNKADNQMKKYTNAAGDLSETSSDLKSSADLLQKTIKTVERSAKELGVKPDAIDGYNNAVKKAEQFADQYAFIRRVLK